MLAFIDRSSIVSAWAGDSRIVLGRNLCNSESKTVETVSVELSKDHKPGDFDEKKRIIACNGRVDRMVSQAQTTVGVGIWEGWLSTISKETLMEI